MNRARALANQTCAPMGIRGLANSLEQDEVVWAWGAFALTW